MVTELGVRPVAIGEYFYRIAAAHAFRVVREYMAELLSPHQYGIGISNGCEKIIHNISHSLTNLSNDPSPPLACLSEIGEIDTIDRSRLLEKLYSIDELNSLWRIVHFAYNTPSALLLSKTNVHLQSENGVRQGDPLSSLLFCLGIKDILDSASASASVRIIWFH